MSPVNPDKLAQFCASYPSLTICTQSEIVSDNQLLRLLKSYLQQENIFQQVLTIIALVLVIICCVTIIWCVCQFWRFVQHSRPHVQEVSCCTKYWMFLIRKLSACCICLFCHDMVDVSGQHIENQ